MEDAARYKKIIDIVPEAIISIDYAPRVVLFNHGVELLHQSHSY